MILYYETEDNTLYHHGVKGMRWGHRKPSAEKTAYKNAKKKWRKEARVYNRQAQTAYGIKRLNALNKQEKKVNDLELKTIHAKAAYKASKKDSKEKAAKAEMKSYVKEMGKSGLVGSAADKMSGGRSERLYNDIRVKKGKKYADAVMKKTQNRAIATIAGSAAVVVGANVVSAILANKSY